MKRKPARKWTPRGISHLKTLLVRVAIEPPGGSISLALLAQRMLRKHPLKGV